MNAENNINPVILWINNLVIQKEFFLSDMICSYFDFTFVLYNMKKGKLEIKIKQVMIGDNFIHCSIDNDSF